MGGWGGVGGGGGGMGGGGHVNIQVEPTLNCDRNRLGFSLGCAWMSTWSKLCICSLYLCVLCFCLWSAIQATCSVCSQRRQCSQWPVAAVATIDTNRCPIVRWRRPLISLWPPLTGCTVTLVLAAYSGCRSRCTLLFKTWCVSMIFTHDRR